MNNILPFITSWMDLEAIMPSEMSERKTYFLNLESG